ncbi:U32 family peptidase [Methanothermobacter thermautotrophicus]|uniref:U32 family peptidase n=1 Tax=Methanothermobacter thermautotrophicus TaxID=145262 RepID=A0A842YNA3_METTF|nr:U32 family peptidase [Methanothermobacter thermautotrophicus]MBE2899624.1 U32 family peptidase [Methanothermobacter thermautotrophicus]
MEIPELLAPAGSPDTFRVALNAGADAVYLSGKDFGARYYAENFSLREIREAVDYAHLHDRRVYVTLNTLIRDSEIQRVSDYLQELHAAGADAVIIQDPSILFLRDELSLDIPLHASTQMTIHNMAGIKWAEDVGLERVILARELSVDEIRDITSKAGVDIEVFIHGALCYSYSGQCLLSSFIGGRSGNRGRCAQPCRKKYELIQLKPGRRVVKLPWKYLLSTRDLSAYMHLDRLVDAGVSSLKIEGRMRSAEYVATTVSVYRRALDEIKEGRWRPSRKEFERLMLTFNRTLKGGHLVGEDFMGREYPGDRGLPIGYVEKYSMGRAIVRLTSETVPRRGDGLFFQKNSMGIRLGDHLLDGGILSIPSKPVTPGSRVYLTGRRELQKFTEKLRSSHPPHLWDVELRFIASEDGEVHLTAEWSMDGRTLRESIDAKFERALRRPLAPDTIREQLLKAGDKPFRLSFAEFRYPGGLFHPISGLNALRRELLSRVEKRIIEEKRSEKVKEKKSSEKVSEGFAGRSAAGGGDQSPCISVYVEDLPSLETALMAGAGRVYFEPMIHRDFRECDWNDVRSILREARDIASGYDAEFVWKWPDITHDWLLRRLLKIEDELNLNIMVGGFGIPELIRGGVKIYGSPALNIFNSISSMLMSGRFHMLTVSPELSGEDLMGMEGNLEVPVHGNLTAMVTRDNLWRLVPKDFNTGSDSLWALRDSRGATFPMNQLMGCETVIMNSRETCLIDFLPSLLRWGFRNFSIDCRIYPPGRTRALVESYIEALENPEGIVDIKEKIEGESEYGITASHFRHGLRE